MSSSWTINVGGRTYGPYSEEQMTAFAAEGRLVAQSLVARAGEAEFRAASMEPALAGLLVPVAKAPAILPAASEAIPVRAEPGSVFGRNREEGQKTGERSHIIVIADMKSRSIAGLEEEIYKLGQAYSILPQIWLLRTEQSVNTVRNLLVQQLGKLDVLFVVDATNNKAAWFNFGPEADARIRRIWTRSPDATAPMREAG
jgi:hypothetical protein